MPLGTAHTEIHLYHASKAPIVVYSDAEKKAAMFNAKGEPNGYGTAYIHQEYPKMVTIGEDRDGNVIQRTVLNADEEKALLVSLLPPTPAAVEVKA